MSTENEADSDTLAGPLWSPLLKSTIVPGWGQMEQNHPGRAVIYYGLGAYTLYNSIYYRHRFHVTENTRYKSKYLTFIRLFAQMYTLNILDVLDTHFNKRYKPWVGEMFSDQSIKSPWAAVARSAMLPGWGQIYNEQYIKAILVFAIVFDFGRKVYVFNHRYEQSGETGMRDRRVVNSWYFGLFYALNMVDAYVDASLFKFDESMQLTYYIQPGEESLSVGIAFVF